jgi:DNA-binding GntR family transcriptional regulator
VFGVYNRVDVYVDIPNKTSNRLKMSKTPQKSQDAGVDRNRLTAEAYAALKTAISSGEFRPRERLYETVLAKQFKMSRTPVREALQRLVSEALAVSGPDGVSVATLSVEDIRSLEQVNRALQGLAAQLAVTGGSESELEELETFMARMEACVPMRDLDGWIAADQEIHRQIVKMGKNPWVWKLYLQLEAIISRVRHLALRAPGRLEVSTQEHRAFVNAIKSRNAEAAQRAIHYHIAQTEENMITILETFVVPVKGDRF